MTFVLEPWGPIVLCGVIASALWLAAWTALKVKGRFSKSELGGGPALIGGLVLCSLFGAVVLIVGAILTALLSVFWMFAVATGTFEKERSALASVMTPGPQENPPGQ